MSSVEQNPIKKLYDALWEMLDDSTELKELVKPGNQLKWMENHTWKDQILDADLPEIQIVPVTVTPHLQRTSNMSSMLEQFAIRVATGDQRIDKNLFDIRWAVYGAMSNWATRLAALTWNSNKFVKLCRPRSITEGMIEGTADRGLTGWFSVWAAEVEMWFQTSDLQA